MRKIDYDYKVTYAHVWTVLGTWEVNDNLAHPALVWKQHVVATHQDLHHILISASVLSTHHMGNKFSFLF